MNTSIYILFIPWVNLTRTNGAWRQPAVATNVPPHDSVKPHKRLCIAFAIWTIVPMTAFCCWKREFLTFYIWVDELGSVAAGELGVKQPLLLQQRLQQLLLKGSFSQLHLLKSLLLLLKCCLHCFVLFCQIERSLLCERRGRDSKQDDWQHPWGEHLGENI